MPIERLTAEEQVMLWPDDIWPQEIGALVILDGTKLIDGQGRFRIETARAAVEARLHLVPRFRQLLYVPPKRLGSALWMDAAAFDIGEHVKVFPLPAPADQAQLLLATEQLRQRRLDRSRPLWEMWFLPGLQENRAGMFVRTHHAVADGIAGVATLATFLEVDADGSAPAPPPWRPTPQPTDAELMTDKRQRQGRESRRRLSMLAHPLTTLRRTLSAGPALRELLAEPALLPTSLDRPVGPARSFALIRSNLDVVKEVAHQHGATVNDVLLTVIAGGLRALLRHRGEPVDGVVSRIYVPVSLRHGQYADARGNSIAQMVVPLPIGVGNSVERLRQIAAETARRKLQARPSVGTLPTRGIAGRLMLKLIARQRVNVESADIPGPETPLYFAGARLLEVFPILPLIGTVSLGVGAMSYAGAFSITAVADRDAYPDLEVFANGLRNELQALELTRQADHGSTCRAV